MKFKALSDRVSPPSKTVWYVGLLAISRKVILPFFTRSYDIHVEPFDKEIEQPCFMVYNHCSRRDFFVTVSGFRYYGRYVVVDSFLRGPMLRFILPVLSDFIYRRRGQVADNVVESSKLTLERGINVYLSPEGTTSQNGTTATIRARTGKMIKECGVGLVTYRVWGSYFLKPTWANNRAKGPVFGKVVNTYTKEYIASLTPEQINDLIAKDIHMNNYEWIKEARIPYDREDRAECMERVLFTCPKCGRTGVMKSMKDTLFCKECGYSVDVDEYGLFVGEDVIFDNLYDWDIWQIEQIKEKRQYYIDHPEVIIASEYNLVLEEQEGDVPNVVDEDVFIEITSAELRIIGKKVKYTVPISELHSIFPSSLDTIGVTFDSKYLLLKSSLPICNRRFRFIYKILRGEEPL